MWPSLTLEETLPNQTSNDNFLQLVQQVLGCEDAGENLHQEWTADKTMVMTTLFLWTRTNLLTILKTVKKKIPQ